MADKFIRARISPESHAGWLAFRNQRRAPSMNLLIEVIGRILADAPDSDVLNLQEVVDRAWDLRDEGE